MDLTRICHDFYGDLYQHREVSEESLREVFEGFSVTFTDSMNASLTKVITEKKLVAMAKGKASGHDGFP